MQRLSARLGWLQALQHEVYSSLFAACEICQFSESKRIKYEQDMYDEKRLRGEMKGERRKGVEEGRMAEKLENAKALKERGVSLEIISEALGLPIETVREL